MRATFGLLATGCVLVAGATLAHADPHNELSIGSFARAMHASSADAVTSDSLGGGVLTYARELPLGLASGLQTWATAQLAWGSASGTMFSTLTTEIGTLAVSVGGRARYQLHPRFGVGGRLDFGTSRAALTLTEGSRELSDHGWGGTTTAAASADLLALAGSRFKLGLRFELGYTPTSAVALAPKEASDGSMIQLGASQASLGSLDLGGRFFSFTILSQF